MMYEVKVQELTNEAFAPYGKVVEMPKDAKRTSSIEDLWPGLVKWDVSEGELEIAFGVDRRRPLIVEGLERHYTSCELLIPVDSDLIIVVASENDIYNKEALPLAKNVKAFLLKIGQGIFYNKGVWHFCPYPVRDEGSFFVVFKHKTAPNNIIMKNLDKKVELKYF